VGLERSMGLGVGPGPSETGRPAVRPELERSGGSGCRPNAKSRAVAAGDRYI